MINLRTDLRPLDVLLFYCDDKWSWDPCTWWGSIMNNTPDDLVRMDAKNYLSGNSDWTSIHSQLFLFPDKIYRAVPPNIGWDTIDALIARGDKVKVFRPTFKTFTEADAQTVVEAFESYKDYTPYGLPCTLKVIGSQYDLDADVSLGWEAFFGSPDTGIESFDTGDHLFCSCGTNLGFSVLGYKLFTKIQPKAFKGALWENSIINDYAKGKYLQIANTFPAVFANTVSHFNSELVYIGQNF